MAIHLPQQYNEQMIHVLHLSDIHFKKERFKIERTKVCQQLFSSIEKHISSAGLKPNLVFITGDIGWSGEISEYENAEKFINELVKIIDNPNLRLYIVPGNHDVIRSKAQIDSLRYQSSERWKKLLELESNGEVDRIAPRFFGFNSFIERLSTTCSSFVLGNRNKYFFTDSFDHFGCDVTILGLNSAWACEDDNDFEQIALGEYQVYQANQEIKRSNLHLPIALMHHPFSSFHPEDSLGSFAELEKNCQLIFRGHTHKGETTGRVSDGRQVHELSTSAGYLNDIKDEEVGYQFASISPADGVFYVWPYIWSEKNYFYIPHNRSEMLQDKGFVQSRFREKIRSKMTSEKTAIQKESKPATGRNKTVSLDAFQEICSRLKKTEKHEKDVFGISLHNLDMIYEVDVVMSDHETTIDTPIKCAGGSAANTICALSKLGKKVAIAGIINNDSAGDFLHNDFLDNKVDTSCLIKNSNGAGLKTGETIVFATSNGNRSIFVQPGINDIWHDILESNNEKKETFNKLVTSSRIIHVSSFTGKRELDFLQNLMDKVPVDCIVSFTPGSLLAKHGLDNLDDFFRRANIVFLYEQQLNTLIEKSIIGKAVSPNAPLAKKLNLIFEWKESKNFNEPLIIGIKTFMTSDNSPYNQSAYLNIGYGKTQLEKLVQPGVLTRSRNMRKPKDSTGAGDSLAGGVLFSLLEGKDIKTCTDVGYVMAKLASREIGARSGLPENKADLIRHCKKHFSFDLQ